MQQVPLLGLLQLLRPAALKEADTNRTNSAGCFLRDTTREQWKSFLPEFPREESVSMIGKGNKSSRDSTRSREYIGELGDYSRFTWDQVSSIHIFLFMIFRLLINLLNRVKYATARIKLRILNKQFAKIRQSWHELHLWFFSFILEFDIKPLLIFNFSKIFL